MTEATQTVINEFKTLSPDISAAVVFKLNGEVLAANQDTTPEQTQTLTAGLKGITCTGCIGGIEKITIQDINSQLSIVALNDVYLATVSSRMGNQKIIKSLTEIVAPTIIKLSSAPSSVDIVPQQASIPQVQEIPVHLADTKYTPVLETKAPPMPLLPEVSASQFMVEKISGFLVASDTVRLDGEVVAKWQERCDGKQFLNVSIETLEGKTFTCKYKVQKEGKTNAKGIIGIPDKILQSLGCSKGTLVMVKPVIE